MKRYEMDYEREYFNESKDGEWVSYIDASIVIDAFEELLTTVRGECPSVVNEDSGASAVLIGLVLKALKVIEET